MDGTLVNSSLTIPNAINFVRKNLGFEPLEQNYILSKVNDNSINPAKVFYHCDKFEADHEKWFSQYYSQNHHKELVLYDGIESLLDRLKDHGYYLAVATNAYRRSTIESLSHFGIYKAFDTIACCDDVTKCKPHPNMLHKILDELKVDAKEAIFIGDGERDQMAGERANIDYIMVDWGFSDHLDAVRTLDELLERLL